MTEDKTATDTAKPILSLAPSSATAIHPVSDIVTPADINKLAAAFKKFEEFKQRLLNKDDAIVIRNKKFYKKSAWRKWAMACGVSDDLVSIERIPLQGKDADGNFSYRIVVRAFHVPSGRSSLGLAIASLSEKKDWAHPEHDVFTLCHTRAKNRAIADLVGGGEVTAEEVIVDAEPGQTTNVSQAHEGSESDTRSEDSAGHPPRLSADDSTRATGTAWHILSGGVCQQEPIFHKSTAVGTASIDDQHGEVALRPETPISVESGPIKNFLDAKFLAGIKAKHPGEFDYTIRADDKGLLDVVLVRMTSMDSERFKELLDATAWAFSKAAENEGKSASREGR